jgi:hypothetical protein
MGFPYGKADWAVVDGAMFMGWGGSAPGLYTLIAAVICITVLWMGNISEKEQYEKAEK